MYLMSLSLKEYLDRYRCSIKSKLVLNDTEAGLIPSDYDCDFSKNEKCRLYNSVFCADDGVTELDIDYLCREIGNKNCYGYFMHLCGELIGSFDFLICNEFIYIINFGLLKEFRGVGVGRFMLFEIIDKFIDRFGDKHDRIYLTVRESNYIAKSLYESFGFVEET